MWSPGRMPLRQPGVITCLHSHTNRYKSLMHILRNLLYIEASFGFYIHPQYNETHSDHLADNLSCNHVISFSPGLSHSNTSARSRGPPVRSPSRLVLSAMAPSVQSYFNQGLIQSTQKSYSRAMKHFHMFCTKFNLSTPFLLSEYTLCCFAVYLADEGLAPQTAKHYHPAV